MNIRHLTSILWPWFNRAFIARKLPFFAYLRILQLLNSLGLRRRRLIANMNRTARVGNQLPNNLPQLQNLIKRDHESYQEEASFGNVYIGITWASQYNNLCTYRTATIFIFFIHQNCMSILHWPFKFCVDRLSVQYRLHGTVFWFFVSRFEINFIEIVGHGSTGI